MVVAEDGKEVFDMDWNQHVHEEPMIISLFDSLLDEPPASDASPMFGDELVHDCAVQSVDELIEVM